MQQVSFVPFKRGHYGFMSGYLHKLGHVGFCGQPALDVGGQHRAVARQVDNAGYLALRPGLQGFRKLVGDPFQFDVVVDVDGFQAGQITGRGNDLPTFGRDGQTGQFFDDLRHQAGIHRD